MELEQAPYGVYVRVDDLCRITAINSDAFLPSAEGWVRIDEGYGDTYHHAQGNYLPGPLVDERGIYRYKLVGVKAVTRTAEEMDADVPEPATEPTARERIAALEEELRAAKILLGLEV